LKDVLDKDIDLVRDLGSNRSSLPQLSQRKMEDEFKHRFSLDVRN